MSRIRLSLLASLLLLAGLLMAQEQTASPVPTETKPADTQPAPDMTAPTDVKPTSEVKPAGGKLSLKATLVLTPEFCATKIKPKGSFMTKEWGSFDFGKAACTELEPALKGVFHRRALSNPLWCPDLSLLVPTSVKSHLSLLMVPNLKNCLDPLKISE